MKKLIHLLVAIILLNSTIALGEVTHKREILRIHIYENKIINIISKDGKWGVSCSSADHARLLPDHLAYKEIYTQALASKLNGTKVYFEAVCHSNPRVIDIKNMYAE